MGFSMIFFALKEGYDGLELISSILTYPRKAAYDWFFLIIRIYVHITMAWQSLRKTYITMQYVNELETWKLQIISSISNSRSENRILMYHIKYTNVLTTNEYTNTTFRSVWRLLLLNWERKHGNLKNLCWQCVWHISDAEWSGKKVATLTPTKKEIW